MAFRFRQFTIEDAHSTLRIGTDAMLLGSWADPGKSKKILDIGTGCGVLALMMAQKSGAMIKAIDIDQSSITEASNNFSASPWAERLQALEDSIQAFVNREHQDYDYIITNPPFYANSLKSPSPRINHTRHDDSLTLGELAANVIRLLAADGRLAIILPPVSSGQFQLISAHNGLYPLRRLVVYPRAEMPAKRVLTEFSRIRNMPLEISELTILDAPGKFTAEYLALTMSYHNF